MDNIPMKNSALAAIASKRAAQEAGTKSDPIIKRTQTTDPDTGAVTYRQSWSDKSKSGTTKRSTSPSISSVGSKVKSNAGSREFTSVPIPTAAGVKKAEITAPLMKKVDKPAPKSQKEKIAEKKIEDYNKNKESDETFDQYRKRIQERANENAEKAKSHEDKRFFMKNKVKACRTC